MIQAQPHFNLVAETRLKVQKASLHARAHHRLHGVGQDQNVMPAFQRDLHQPDHLRVHEGLSARKADLDRAEAKRVDLIEIGDHVRLGQVDQRIIGGRAEDVAVLALDIAQRAGVEPQRLERIKPHAGAGFALGGDKGV